MSQGRPLPATFSSHNRDSILDSARLSVWRLPALVALALKTKNPGVFSSRVLIDSVLQYDLSGPSPIAILNGTSIAQGAGPCGQATHGLGLMHCSK